MDATGFWKRVRKTKSCWFWTGAKQRGGYGHLYWQGKYIGAHRLAWFLEHGTINKNLYLCHRCDTPACVRPSHMFLGSQADNLRDMTKKGRRVSPEALSSIMKGVCAGEKHPLAKLTGQQVLDIRARSAQGIARKALAREYEVHPGHISLIVARRTWRHL